MKVTDIGELRLIERIIKKISLKDPRILTPVGDDASVIDISSESKIILTTDMLIEKVHFDLDLVTPQQLGHKAAAVNISDIAAMGGSPRFALICLGIKPDTETSFIEEFYGGLIDCLSEFDISLVGGDTVKSEDLTVSVTIIGFTDDNYLRRDKASPGDLVYVSGNLGDSSCGLALSQKKINYTDKSITDKLISAHLKPVPRISLGKDLAKAGAKTAIDISDGLGSDLRHICRQSKVGAIIYKENIPISNSLEELSKRTGIDPFEFVLYGGEDYELLFTLPKRINPPSSKIKITCIGEITKEKKIYLADKKGKKHKLGFGYQHFTT